MPSAPTSGLPLVASSNPASDGKAEPRASCRSSRPRPRFCRASRRTTAESAAETGRWVRRAFRSSMSLLFRLSFASEFAFEDLPGRIAGQRVKEHDVFGDLEARQLGAAVLEEHVRRRSRVRTHNNERHGNLAPSFIRTAHNGRFEY